MNNIKKKSKRSQGHVEMIISFVIFVGFVLAIFIFINPINQQKTSYASLDLVWENLVSNLSSEIRYIPVVLDPTGDMKKSCFSIKDDLNVTENFLVRDFRNNLVLSELQNKKLFIQNTSSKLYNLYSSKLIKNYSSSSLNPCDMLDEDDYSLGVLVSENKIFIKNLQNLNDIYKTDYVALKNNLKLKNNFDFVVYNLTRGVIFNDSLSIHKIRNGDNIARDIPLRVLNENASEIDVIFSLRVW